MSLHVLELSTGYTEMIRESIVGCFRPVLSGDLVMWRHAESGQAPGKIFGYSISSKETRVLVDASLVGVDPGWELWGGGRWLVFQGEYDRAARANRTYALNLAGGQVQDLGPMRPLGVRGDDVIYTPTAVGAREVRIRSLATGSDTMLCGDGEYQEAVTDGNVIAWAAWEDGVACVMTHDMETGADTRVAVPGYQVGTLGLRGGMLVFVGKARVADPKNGQDHTYLFAYDIARARLTRLGRVWTYPEQWSVGDAGVAFVERTVGGPVRRLIVAQPLAAVSQGAFTDVTGTDPYRTAIQGLRDLDVVQGYPSVDGAEFRPQAALTRAQFAKMLATALRIRVTESMDAPFGDLGPDDPESLFPHEYIAALAEEGIIRGTSAGCFSPYAGVSRAQMATLLVRAAQVLHPRSITEPGSQWEGPTLGDFDPLHGPCMAAAEWNWLLDGLVGFGREWDPWAQAGRAEAAQMVWNLRATRLVPEAQSRLEAVLGLVEAETAVEPIPADLPGESDTLLGWQGGFAWLDPDGGITYVTRPASPAQPGEAYLTGAELENVAECVMGALGWDGDSLTFENLRADPPTFSDASGAHEFVKTWTGYTRQGILDSGGIELRLDARDGSVTRFQYHKGARGFDVDLSQILSREEAVDRAVERVEQQFPEVDVEVETATLKFTNAPALTEGDIRLIWLVVVTGREPAGGPGGGWVYVDALTGRILQYLLPS